MYICISSFVVTFVSSSCQQPPFSRQLVQYQFLRGGNKEKKNYIYILLFVHTLLLIFMMSFQFQILFYIYAALGSFFSLCHQKGPADELQKNMKLYSRTRRYNAWQMNYQILSSHTPLHILLPFSSIFIYINPIIWINETDEQTCIYGS